MVLILYHIIPFNVKRLIVETFPARANIYTDPFHGALCPAHITNMERVCPPPFPLTALLVRATLNLILQSMTYESTLRDESGSKRQGYHTP